MANYSGQLKFNELFGGLCNMIISQQVFSNNIAGGSQIVDMARVDGSLLGDTKLYYATDALRSYDWVQDSEETLNLLATHRPPAPACQAIVIDKFRQIPLTLDDYMTKRAFADEGTFSNFNTVLQGWIQDTKRIYDATTYNAFFGTCVSPIATENRNIVLGTSLTAEERAKTIAKSIADLLTDMADFTRDFNDYGFLRAYDEGAIKIIWNKNYINEITKYDLPQIFHKDSLMDKFGEHTLNSRFFGKVNTAATTGDGKLVRSLIEQDIGNNHYFAGDLIKTTDKAPANTSYTVDTKVIAKVVVEMPPYMSAFETGTSFFNARNLSTNHYLTFGRNSLDYLKNYPMITLTETNS